MTAPAGWYCTELTGGGVDALDGLDVSLAGGSQGLTDGDVALVFYNGEFYWYEYNATSGAAESSPAVIAPDYNNGGAYSGNGRWLWRPAAGVETVPVGMVAPFPTNTLPTGWLPCEGGSYVQATYSDLYDFLKDGGSACIYGEDSTNFTLPDYRGEFLRGRDASKGTDPDADDRTDRGDGTDGDVVGSKQTQSVGYHRHRFAGPYWDSSGFNYNCNGCAHAGAPGATSASLYVQYHPEGDADAESRPPNINVRWGIKY
jgi:hypothetical protein